MYCGISHVLIDCTAENKHFSLLCTQTCGDSDSNVISQPKVQTQCTDVA